MSYQHEMQPQGTVQQPPLSYTQQPPPANFSQPPQYSGQPPPQGQQQYPPRDEGGYKGNHPVAAFFHAFFKVLSVLIYLFGSLIGLDTMKSFLVVVLLLAMDFWAVKNVTGRVMVKLRWWNRVTEDGQSEWVFESHPNAPDSGTFDAAFFWLFTYGIVAVWALFLVFTITSPTGIPLTLVGLLTNGANALGYTKCRRDAKQKMSSMLMGAAVSNPGLAMQAMRAAA